MNRKFATLASAALCLSMLLSFNVQAVTQADIDKLQEERNSISQQQNEINDELGKLEDKISTAMEQKKLLDEQVGLILEDINIINEQIGIYDELIAEEQLVVEEAQKNVDIQYARFCQRLRSMEESTTGLSFFSYIFGATSFSDLLGRIYDVFDITSHDQELERDYVAARDYAQGVLDEYEATQAEYEETLAELDERMTDLEAQRKESESFIEELKNDVFAYEQYLIDVDNEKIALENQIYVLTQQMNEQQAATPPAAANPPANTGSGAQTPAATPAPAPIPSGTGGYSWPTYTTLITSRFGYRTHPVTGAIGSFHSGVDIGASFGTPVTAAANGTVILADLYGDYGNCVMIYHPDGNTTLYAHMSSIAVANGQTVSGGQVVGYVGDTGRVTAAHLHFEVRIGGYSSDPLEFFSGLSFSFYDC